MKKFLLLGFILLMAGCSNTPPKVELTPTEVTQLNGDTNKGAELLIRKAILNDMSKYNYTSTEKNNLQLMKENLEIEYYLNTVAAKKVNISDEEVVAIYNNNRDKLKGIKAEVALPQIREQLYLQQINNEKVNYINSLVEKYQLNSKLNSHFPKEAVETVKE